MAPELMIDILENSAARSGLASFKAPFILNRDFTAHFSAKWMHKDVGFATQMARELNVPVPASSVTENMLRAAVAKGLGRRRTSAPPSGCWKTGPAPKIKKA
ncbi:MAG: NAD-binding protein [Acidobacteriota bacterium]